MTVTLSKESKDVYSILIGGKKVPYKLMKLAECEGYYCIMTEDLAYIADLGVKNVSDANHRLNQLAAMFRKGSE